MIKSTTSQRITSLAIATVLFCACAAKAWAMVSTASPMTRFESLFNVLLLQVELALALLLLWRKQIHLALATSGLFFLCATASNLRAIWLGKTSCGCFGNFEIPPEATLCLNIIILFATAYVLRTTKENFTLGLKINRIGLTIPVCLGVVIVAVLVQLGRIQFAARLISIPNKIDFGVIDLGSQKEITIPLKNVAGRDLNIWGGMTTCSCATINGLPANVPKGTEKEVRIVVKPSNLRDINVRAMFYIESSYGDNLTTLVAKVRDPKDPN